VKFSKLSNHLFCSRFLSNPLVNFFNLSNKFLLKCVMPTTSLEGLEELTIQLWQKALLSNK
jgi:hypothetical protein